MPPKKGVSARVHAFVRLRMHALVVCVRVDEGFLLQRVREIFRFPTFLPLHENAPRKVCGDTAHVHACVGLRMHAHIACLHLKKPCSQV